MDNALIWRGINPQIKPTISLSLQKKMKFSIKDFFSKCEQIRSFLWICSYLLKKSLTVKFMFCEVSLNDSNQILLSLIFSQRKL